MAGKKALREALRNAKREKMVSEPDYVESAVVESDDEDVAEDAYVEKIETSMDQFQANAGSSLFYPAQASSVRKGGFILINGYPCKVVHISSAKTGKHGGAKMHFTAVDIFTNKKMECMEGSTANCEIPFVARTEYSLVDISDDFLSLMEENGNIRQDIRTPQNLKKELSEKFNAGSNVYVTVTAAMGQEVAMEYREATKEAK